MDGSNLPECPQPIREVRRGLSSLVFARFCRVFFAFLQWSGTATESGPLCFLRTIFPSNSDCGDCVTLLTTRLWTRIVPSYGSNYQPRSNHRLVPIALSAGFRPSNW